MYTLGLSINTYLVNELLVFLHNRISSPVSFLTDVCALHSLIVLPAG